MEVSVLWRQRTYCNLQFWLLWYQIGSTVIITAENHLLVSKAIKCLVGIITALFLLIKIFSVTCIDSSP